VSRPTLYNAGQLYLDKDNDWICLLGSNETQTDPLPELSDLTLAVATINAWNRLAFLPGTVPGEYPPAKP